MDLNQKEANFIRKGAQDVWPGAYRGVIESIDDPDRLGRVRVRVFAVNGDVTRTPTSALPFAEIAEPGGGGYDYGSYDPPPVGSTVFVLFEGGDSLMPVVFGTFRGLPRRDQDNPQVMLVKDGKPETESPWLPPEDELETPKDVFDGVYYGDPHPTRRVWKKSYKGHTILIEDGDGKEFLKIIDRAGQILEMSCPVDKQYSSANKAQRGTRDATRGDQLPHDIMVDRRAHVRIKDLSGQEIMLSAVDQNEKIRISSRSRSGASVNTIELSSGPGKESIEIRDSGGNTFTMNPNSGQPIRIEDTIGNKIIFDKEQGKVQVISAKLSEASAQQQSISIAGKSEVTVGGDAKQKVLGNKKTNVSNDLSLGVMGNTTATLGGHLEVIVANQALNPPYLGGKGVKLSLANVLSGCDLEVANQRGKIKLNTLIGNVELSCTGLGNATLSTSVGNVECSTVTGNATLKTTAGITNVDSGTPAASVKLGGVISAVHPLLKGDLVDAALLAFNNTHLLAVGPMSPLFLAVSALAGTMSSPVPIPVMSNMLAPFFAAFVLALGVQTGAYSVLSGALASFLSIKCMTE